LKKENTKLYIDMNCTHLSWFRISCSFRPETYRKNALIVYSELHHDNRLHSSRFWQPLWNFDIFCKVYGDSLRYNTHS